MRKLVLREGEYSMVNLLSFEFCGNMFYFAFVVRLLGVLRGCFLSVFLERVRCVSGVLKI